MWGFMQNDQVCAVHFLDQEPTPNVLRKQAYRVSCYSSRVYTWITHFKLDHLSKKMILNFFGLKEIREPLFKEK